MKINIGDIYREQKSKYDFVSAFQSEKILDITFGKYFDFAKSKILFSSGAKEIWNLDLLNNDQYVTVTKINDSGKIIFQKKNIDKLWQTKFNLILSFNMMRISSNIDQILKIIQNCLSSDGLIVISILNNSVFSINNSNFSSSKETLFTIDLFEKKLLSNFHDVLFFSQGEISQIENYAKNIIYKKSFLGNFMYLIKKRLKSFFNQNTKRQIFYLQYLRPLYLLYKNFRRRKKFKINLKKYDVIPYNKEKIPISIIAKCKKII